MAQTAEIPIFDHGDDVAQGFLAQSIHASAFGPAGFDTRRGGRVGFGACRLLGGPERALDFGAHGADIVAWGSIARGPVATKTPSPDGKSFFAIGNAAIVLEDYVFGTPEHESLTEAAGQMAAPAQHKASPSMSTQKGSPHSFRDSEILSDAGNEKFVMSGRQGPLPARGATVDIAA